MCNAGEASFHSPPFPPLLPPQTQRLSTRRIRLPEPVSTHSYRSNSYRFTHLPPALSPLLRTHAFEKCFRSIYSTHEREVRDAHSGLDRGSTCFDGTGALWLSCVGTHGDTRHVGTEAQWWDEAVSVDASAFTVASG